jgi:hypothetical protein
MSPTRVLRALFLASMKVKKCKFFAKKQKKTKSHKFEKTTYFLAIFFVKDSKKTHPAKDSNLWLMTPVFSFSRKNRQKIRIYGDSHSSSHDSMTSLTHH